MEIPKELLSIEDKVIKPVKLGEFQRYGLQTVFIEKKIQIFHGLFDFQGSPCLVTSGSIPT